jgi:hypothetical protein
VTPIELSIVLPCLNEAETVAVCVRKALKEMEAIGVTGEVILADNGSTDGSPQLASEAGARVVHVPERGYGAAIRGGIQAARGRYVLMADADDSYELDNLMPFVEKLRDGYELVMGNRFRGGIEPGAMPFLHKLGNPVLSCFGRWFFKTPINDFHCGIRAFDRQRVLDLDLHTTGMEFASELVVQASLARLRIAEVPTRLAKDGRSRPPHLRTWRDGWRHLRFLLLYSPGWLFLVPGFALLVAGVQGMVLTAAGPRRMGGIVFDTGTLVTSAMLLLVSVQLILFWATARSFATEHGLLPRSLGFERWMRRLSLERIAPVGVLVMAAGGVGIALSLARWERTGFGELNRADHLRLLVPSATALVVGVQIVFGAFLLALPRLRMGAASTANGRTRDTVADAA